jgi:hypothetical protein
MVRPTPQFVRWNPVFSVANFNPTQPAEPALPEFDLGTGVADVKISIEQNGPINGLRPDRVGRIAAIAVAGESI